MTDRSDYIRIAQGWALVMVTFSLAMTVWWVSTTQLWVLGMRYGLWLNLAVRGWWW